MLNPSLGLDMPSMSLAYRYVNGILDIHGIFFYRPDMPEKDPRIIVPMPPELVEAIDEYRFENRLPSRAEAIRTLILKGLKAEKTERQAAPTG